MKVNIWPMLVKWSKDGNKCFCVEFDKFTLYNIFRVNNTDSVKGINSYIEKNWWLFGFKFTYINVDYDDIVFIELKPEDNYTSSEDSHKVKVLKETLKSFVNSGEYDKYKPAFNWNFYKREDGEYIFFITGPKQWFIDNGLSCLVNSLREITFDNDKEIYFPKYNPFKTNIVSYITTYYNLDEE